MARQVCGGAVARQGDADGIPDPLQDRYAEAHRPQALRAGARRGARQRWLQGPKLDTMKPLMSMPTNDSMHAYLRLAHMLLPPVAISY